MSFLGKVGGAIKGAVKGVGGLAEKAAPFVGMIPGVGAPMGALIGGAGALAHGDGLKGALKYGAEGGLSGFGGGLLKGTQAGANAAADGGSFLSKIGGTLKNVGTQVAGNFKKPDGSLDFSKIVAAGGAASNLIGQSKQRKSATNYNNAQIDQRNKLMNQIMAPQNYNLPSITPASNNNAGY